MQECACGQIHDPPRTRRHAPFTRRRHFLLMDMTAMKPGCPVHEIRLSFAGDNVSVVDSMLRCH